MSTTTPRRWNGFVCPTCRSLFRVPADHDGSGVVCPQCRSMLRLPLPGEETPPLVVKGAAKRRRRHAEHRRDKRAREIFDETFADKTGPAPIYARVLVAAVATLAVVVAVGLLWPRGGTAPGVAGGSDPGGAPPPSPPPEEEPEPLVLTVATVRDELQPVAEAFLDAPDIESAAARTARPDRTLGRMRAYRDGEYRPPGFKSVLWNQSMSRGPGWAAFRIETNEFERRTIFLVEDDGWKVDWESWVGWSPVSWDELKETRPAEPVRIRALVRPREYYNFGFSSEAEWAAFELASPDNRAVVYGYVPRGSELYSRLSFLDGSQERRQILDIRYPADSPADNQVHIVGVVGEDWLDTGDLP